MPNITDRAAELAKSLTIDAVPDTAKGKVNEWEVTGDLTGTVSGRYDRTLKRVTVGVYAGAVLRGAKRVYAGFRVGGRF